MDLSTTNTWLAVLVVVGVIQTTGFIAVAFLVWREAMRVSSAVETLTREVRPILHRTDAVLDDVQDLAARARHADAQIQAAASHVAETWTRATSFVRFRVFPGVVIAKGLRAIAAAARRRHPVYRDAESRFVHEGGIHAANVRH